MLWPIGKDSTVLLWLTRKAFFDHVPFPLIHVDTSNAAISLVQLRFGDHLIDLLPGTGEPGSGLDHFCLSIGCDDLSALAAELRGRGVDVDGEVAERRGAFGRGPSLYLRDPDGYRIELKPR
jgi:catechol 2,3-dioxygenase-like lactoylglutathione lyase family enzyme